MGWTRAARPEEVAAAIDAAADAAPGWAATAPNERAAILRHAADALEGRTDDLIGLLVREAGKTFANAVAEVREAVDFLRYYAAEALRVLTPGAPPLGVVACISPWNFPLAIFTGQVAAALAAGNAVVAKPAEETPLIAAEAVRILHEAGVPSNVLALVPGAGDVGAAIVADPRIQGVVFTGSTAVARLIEKQLAGRLSQSGAAVPLIAETGGINAMVVDSSALPEQVAADVMASAFDSAGQRCSALRILCLQEDVASSMLAMLKGAMAELEVDDPRRLSTDVGPIITAEAAEAIQAYVEAMRGRGFPVTQAGAPEAGRRGSFVTPAMIEVTRVADVEREVFGPVLHVLRYRREALDALIDAINAAGYGLTFGLHTRIDETIARVSERIEAGNIYINRNVIGATVGVQPFGGSRLSGTGPKAGGPLYLARLLAEPTRAALEGLEGDGAALNAIRAFTGWLSASGHSAEAERCVGLMARSPLGARVELSGTGRGTEHLHLAPARPHRGDRDRAERGACADRDDPGDGQRRDCRCERRRDAERPAARARPPHRNGVVPARCAGARRRARRLRKGSGRRRAPPAGGAARPDRPASGADARAARRGGGLRPCGSLRGACNRHQHRRSRGQRESDDDRMRSDALKPTGGVAH